MANELYDHVGSPPTGSQLSSAIIRAEFDKVEAGFDKLPVMSTAANQVVVVNSTGTALTATASPTISGGTINGASVGAVVPASGAFTTLTASSTATVPTVAADTNTTAAASTAFVLGQAASTVPVMDGVAAVGASTRFARADHVHASDTTKANLAGPTFTGVPAAPTAAADTNTTQLATTQFVIGQVATTTPLINGTAAVGSLLKFAKADHVHPTDTSRAPTASPTFTGTVTLPATGAGANEAATKSYVDTVAAAGLDVHTACDYATTANINLATNNLTAVDGTVLTAGMRVLVKNQTTTTENGLYTVVGAGAWTRTTDADASGEIKLNSYVFVNNGTVNAKTGWTQQTSGTIIPGTNAMVWTQFSSSQSYTNGAGLSLVGNTFSLTTPVAVANGGTGATTSTGSGAVVLASSPVLTTPNLGVPSLITLTSATGLPLATGVTGTLPVLNGGTGVTTAQAEMNRVAAAVTSGQYLRGNGTNVVMSAIQAADVPTLNQNTTGSAASATTSTNLALGGAGQIPWQSAAATTGFTAAGTTGQVLTSNGATVPTWTAQSALVVGSATKATNLVGTVAGAIPYQSGTDTTLFSAAGTTGQVLISGAAGAPTWIAQSSIAAGTATTAGSATNATNLTGSGTVSATATGGAGLTPTNATNATHLVGSTIGSIPYQSAANTTTQLAPGTSGFYLKSNGAGAAPAWAAVTSGGNLLGVQVFTSSGTYTPTAGTNRIGYELCGGSGGGGGGGGNGQWNLGSTPTAGGAGGGGAASSILRGTVACSTTQTITIGGAGTLGTGGAGRPNGAVAVGTAGTSGGAGGTTSIGALASQAGGVGGGGGGGGLATNGSGAAGTAGVNSNPDTFFLSLSASGSVGALNGIGQKRTAGNGGGGGAAVADSPGGNGAAGNSGYAIIWEYS